MNENRFTLRIAVFLVLIKNEKILLQRRFNTGWEDGNYSFVSGHVEKDETIKMAAIREAQEEAGLTIHQEDIEVVHVMHNNTDFPYINFFLSVKKWNGVVKNMEPKRCDELSWYELDNMPDNLLLFLKEFLKMKKGTIFSEFGF